MTREAGWRYGIISTVSYEQQKIYRQIILFQIIYYLSISLTGLPYHREPSIVLMSKGGFIRRAKIGANARRREDGDTSIIHTY